MKPRILSTLILPMMLLAACQDAPQAAANNAQGSDKPTASAEAQSDAIETSI